MAQVAWVTSTTHRPAPGAATAPTTAAPTTAPPTTQKPTATTAPQIIEVTINVSGFSPQNVRVFTNQTVRFTNKDSEARSVQASDNSFSSGDIAPGGTWNFSTGKPGRYDIVDGTRPFVVGVIEVLAR